MIYFPRSYDTFESYQTPYSFRVQLPINILSERTLNDE